jgi:uncharacterized RDD family membrane protein YckC
MIPEAIVRFRARRLPEELASRLAEEWLAELGAVESPTARLRFAIALLLMSTRALERDSERRDLSAGIAPAMAFREGRLYAGAWSRVPALLLDAFLTNVASRILEAAPYGLAWIVLTQVVCVARFGGSPGKLLMGLRVGDADGTALTWRQAWLREAPYLAMYAIGTAMPAGPAAGFRWWVALAMATWIATDVVVYIWNGRHRALHDLMAGTVVIHKKTVAIRTDRA